MSSLTHKRCTKCGELKSVDNFVKDPQKKDGLYSSCKQCYASKYKGTSYHGERAKKWRSVDREEKLEKKRAKWFENHAANLAALADYHAKNKEKEKEYRQQHKDRISLTSKLWGIVNRERRNATLRAHRKNNPEKVRVYKNNRRAYEKASNGKITPAEWMGLLDKYGHKCLCCGATNVKLALDHIVPLSLGGSNTIDNAQPLCKSCNSRKGNRYVADYRPF